MISRTRPFSFQINFECKRTPGILQAFKLSTICPFSGNRDGIVYGAIIAIPLGSTAVATLMFFVICAQFIPESARFNVSTGNTQAAMTTLESIAKMNSSAMPEGKLVEPILVSTQLGGLLPPLGRLEIPLVVEG